MKDKHLEIAARDLKPGDLVYSPRTDQLMLVLSTVEVIKLENDKAEERIQLSWLPLTKNVTRMETNVNPGIIYLGP